MKRRVILLATNTLLVVLMAIGMVSQAQAQQSVPARHSMPAVTPLPSGWVDNEINEVGGGYSLNATGTLLVQGSGADIWGTSDSFHYTSRPAVVVGDQLYAHVDSQTGTSPWAKAGIMIRASATGASDAYAFLASTPGNGLVLQYRASSGAFSQNFAAGAANSPTYLKLSSAGNVVTAYTGSDGINWTQVGTPVTIALGATPSIGMAVTSHSAGTYNLATFSKIGPDVFVPPVAVTGLPALSNLVALAPVTASSSVTGNGPQYADDADVSPSTSSTTYWANMTSDTTPWIQVDLGTPYIVQNIVTTWRSAAGSPTNIAAGDVPTEFSTTAAAATAASAVLGSVNGTSWYIITPGVVAPSAVPTTAPTASMTETLGPLHGALTRYIRLVFASGAHSFKLLDLQVNGSLVIV